MYIYIYIYNIIKYIFKITIFHKKWYYLQSNLYFNNDVYICKVFIYKKLFNLNKLKYSKLLKVNNLLDI